MKTTNWKDIAELIGIAAIVGSLIFVGFQMRQDKLIAEAQIYTEGDDTTVNLAQLIGENSDIWKKGLDGDDLTESEQLKFDSLARAYYLGRISRYERAKRLGIGDSERLANFTAFHIYQYPGLRRAFDRQQEKFELMNKVFGYATTTELTREIYRILPELDAAAPTLPKKDYVLF